MSAQPSLATRQQLGKTLTREDRIKMFGLDCGDGLDWGVHWSPGGDYCKTLTFQNVTTQNIKVTYELPATRFFFMKFPEPIILAPGVSRSVNVNFRPVKMTEYHDFITVSTIVGPGGSVKDGTFRVPVAASLPRLVVNIPSNVNLGVAGVGEVTEATFTMKNIGAVPAYFSWSTGGVPLTLSPASGCIAPDGGEQVITVRIVPESAYAIDVLFPCTISDRPAPGSPADLLVSTLSSLGTSSAFSASSSSLLPPQPALTHTLRMQGIARYPFLELSSPRVDFGIFLTDQTREGRTVLHNRTDALTTWRLRRVEQDVQPSFRVYPDKGVLGPHQSVEIKILYEPRASNTHSCDHYALLFPGCRGTPPELVVSGSSVGPVARLSTWSIDFGDVDVTKVKASAPNKVSISKELVIFNSSSSPLHFSFPGLDAVASADTSVLLAVAASASSSVNERPPCAAFTVTPSSGVIPPFLSAAVSVRFTPTLPVNYYQRLFCAIHHQLPMFVDLLGTGYTDKQRPMPFTQAHVDAYRTRIAIDSSLRLMGPQSVAALLAGARKSEFRSATALLPPPTAAALAAAAASMDPSSASSLASPSSSSATQVALSSALASSSSSAHANPSLHPLAFVSPRATIARSEAVAAKGLLVPTATGPLVWPEEGLVFPGLSDQVFLDRLNPTEEVQILTERQLHFGRVAPEGASEWRTVKLLNRSDAKVTASWLLPSAQALSAAQGSSLFMNGSTTALVQQQRAASSSTSSSSSSSSSSSLASGAGIVPASLTSARPPAFVVSPGSADIGPGEVAEFRVLFAPPTHAPGAFENLQCLVYFKSQRTFRLVESSSFTPPLLLKVPALGYSDSTRRNAAYLVNARLSNERVEFPAVACHEGRAAGGAGEAQRSYQTVLLKNEGDTTMVYHIPCADVNGFSVYPSMGSIGPGGSVVLSLRFDPTQAAEAETANASANANANSTTGGGGVGVGLPTVGSTIALIDEMDEAKNTGVPSTSSSSSSSSFSNSKDSGMPVRYSGVFKVIVNGNEAEPLQLNVSGACYPPVLELEDGGSVLFRPTCLGMSSRKTVAMRNRSRIPLQFRWVVAAADVREVAVSPSIGVIPPNEALEVTWTYKPRSIRSATYAVPCYVRPLVAPLQVLKEESGANADTQGTEDGAEEGNGSADGDDSKSLIVATAAAAAATAVGKKSITTGAVSSSKPTSHGNVLASTGAVVVKKPRQRASNESTLRRQLRQQLSQAAEESVSPELRAALACLKGGSLASAKYLPANPNASRQRGETTVLAVCKGYCSFGAVAFDPPHLGMGDILVNRPAPASFSIKNSSDVPLVYALDVQELSPYGTVAEAEARAATAMMTISTSKRDKVLDDASFRQLIRERRCSVTAFANASTSLTNSSSVSHPMSSPTSSSPLALPRVNDALHLTPSVGEVPARSSHLVSLHLTPTQAKSYRFKVSCLFSRASPIQRQQQHQQHRGNDPNNEDNDDDDDDDDDDDAEDATVQRESIIIEATGAAPAVLVTDAWIDRPASVASSLGSEPDDRPWGLRGVDALGSRAVWSQLDLDRLNAYLGSAYRGAEAASEAAGAAMTLRQAVRSLHGVTLNMGVGLLVPGTRSSVFAAMANSSNNSSSASALNATTTGNSNSNSNGASTNGAVVLRGGIQAPIRKSSNRGELVATPSAISAANAAAGISGELLGRDPAGAGASIGGGAGGYKTVFLRLTNPGNIDTTWSIKTPEEDDSGLEHWGDPGDPDPELRCTHALNSRQIFQVRPRSGLLKAGQSAVVQATYLHRARGVHEKPYVFQVTGGAQVVWKLKGETIGPATSPRFARFASSHLHSTYIPRVLLPSLLSATTSATSQKSPSPNTQLARGMQVQLSESARTMPFHNVWFAPVPLGLELAADGSNATNEAPAQTVSLVNDTPVWLAFRVRKDPLCAHAAANYGTRVFDVVEECLQGLVPPGATYPLQVRFRPLELRAYSVPLALDIVPASARRAAVVMQKGVVDAMSEAALSVPQFATLHGGMLPPAPTTALAKAKAAAARAMPALTLADIQALDAAVQGAVDVQSGRVLKAPSQVFMLHGRATIPGLPSPFLPEHVINALVQGPVTSRLLALVAADVADTVAAVTSSTVSGSSSSSNSSNSSSSNSTAMVESSLTSGIATSLTAASRLSYHPATIYARGPWCVPSSLPSTQRLLAPGQFVSLSASEVDFGVLHPFSATTRIVTLTNLSRRIVTFQWHRPAARTSITHTTAVSSLLPVHVSGNVAVEQSDRDRASVPVVPAVHVSMPSGELEPLQSVTLKITVAAGSHAQIFTDTLLCDVSFANPRSYASGSSSSSSGSRPSSAASVQGDSMYSYTSSGDAASGSASTSASSSPLRSSSSSSSSSTGIAERDVYGLGTSSAALDKRPSVVLVGQSRRDLLRKQHAAASASSATSTATATATAATTTAGKVPTSTSASTSAVGDDAECSSTLSSNIVVEDTASSDLVADIERELEASHVSTLTVPAGGLLQPLSGEWLDQVRLATEALMANPSSGLRNGVGKKGGGNVHAVAGNDDDDGGSDESAKLLLDDDIISSLRRRQYMTLSLTLSGAVLTPSVISSGAFAFASPAAAATTAAAVACARTRKEAVSPDDADMSAASHTNALSVPITSLAVSAPSSSSSSSSSSLSSAGSANASLTLSAGESKVITDVLQAIARSIAREPEVASMARNVLATAASDDSARQYQHTPVFTGHGHESLSNVSSTAPYEAIALPKDARLPRFQASPTSPTTAAAAAPSGSAVASPSATPSTSVQHPAFASIAGRVLAEALSSAIDEAKAGKFDLSKATRQFISKNPTL